MPAGPGASEEILLYANNNVYACNLTASSKFKLEKDAALTYMAAWYNWRSGENSVGFHLSREGQTVTEGQFQRGGCDPNQAAWCKAELRLNESVYLPAGDYALTLDRTQMCANSGSNGEGFVYLYGMWAAPPPGAQTVGPEGAEIDIPGATVNISSGTFDETADMSLSQLDADSEPGQGVATGAYRLDGLPWTVRNPVRIALDAAGQLPDGEAFLVMKFDGEPGPVFVPATVEDGRLVAELPAMPPDEIPQEVSKANGRRFGQATGNRTGVVVLAMAGFADEISKSGNFIVRYPAGDIRDHDMALAVCDMMDDALAKLKAVGVKKIDQRVGPVDVYLYPFSGLLATVYRSNPNDAGAAESQVWGKQFAGVTLNLEEMKNGRMDYVRATAGHELFHVYQNLYDPRGLWRRSRFASPWCWMMDAASTWFEKRMVNNAGYLSENTRAHSDFLLRHGLEYPPPSLASADPVMEHGYGAALFLEYLTSTKGDTFVGDLFDDMATATGTVLRSSLYSPVDALDRKQDMLWGKWSDFVVRYARGEVNSKLSIADMLTPPTNALTIERTVIQNDGDLPAAFKWSAPDLAARLYRLDLRNTTTGWQSGDKLTVALNGPPEAEVSIWQSVKDGGWQLVDKTRSTYEIANADQLAKSGTSLLFLIANGHMVQPYDGTTAIGLTVTGPAARPAAGGGAYIDVYFDSDKPGTISRTAGGTPDTTTDRLSWHLYNRNVFINGDVNNPFPKLTWNGNNFTASASWVYAWKSGTTSCERKYSESFSGQVAADGQKLASGLMTYGWTTTDNVNCKSWNDYFTYSQEITLADVPLASGEGHNVSFGWSAQAPQNRLRLKYKYSKTAGFDYNTMEVWELTGVDYTSPGWSLSVQFRD